MAKKVISAILFLGSAFFVVVGVYEVSINNQLASLLTAYGVAGVNTGFFSFSFVFAAVLAVIGIVVLKCKEETLLKLFGIVSIIGGILLVFSGSAMNRDFNAFLQHGPNPGNGLMTGGVMCFILGLGLIALCVWKKHVAKG